MVTFVTKPTFIHTPPAVVTPAKKTPPILKKKAIKREFPTGSIISINGRDMDYIRFKVRKNTPVFYGIVKTTRKNESGKEISETNEMISFIVSGKYEWYNKNGHNVLTSTYHTGLLTISSPPPNDSSYQHPFSEEDSLRWFTKTVGG